MIERARRSPTVDLYGDSYGTFFAQVFAGRHPDLVRSVVLDSAYPTYGETALVPHPGPGDARRAFTRPASAPRDCRTAGRPFLPALRRVLAQRARRSRGGDGRTTPTAGRMRVRSTRRTLVYVAFGATYAPAFYRELTAALRSGLRGDRAPLLRLVAEATGGGTDAGPVRGVQRGPRRGRRLPRLPAALRHDGAAGRCASAAVRRGARRAARARTPHTYGPFTVARVRRLRLAGLDWCTRWPTAPAGQPGRSTRTPGWRYPDVPVLVLSGEIDSITTPAEGDTRGAGSSPSAQHVVLRNSFHVTAIDDTDDCADASCVPSVRSPGPRRPSCAELRAGPRADTRPGALRPPRSPTSLRQSRPRSTDQAPSAAPAAALHRRRRAWTAGGTTTPAAASGCTAAPSATRATTREAPPGGFRLLRDFAVSGLATWDRDRRR